MRWRHHKPEEIADTLARAEQLVQEGLMGREIVVALGVGHATLARWRSKFSGASADQIAHIKTLEKQNSRLLLAMDDYSVT